MRELKLNKAQFAIFNDYDQFQIFADEEGFTNFDIIKSEVDKLFNRFEVVIVTEDDYIYGEKNGKRELIMSDAFEAFSIALEVLEEDD